MQRETLFKTVNSKKCKKINQHDLNIFTREYNDEFEIKFYIYAEDKDRILFAQRYLENISTTDWSRHKFIIEFTILFWQQFIDFLQKKLNSKNLQILNVNWKLKNVRQRLEQKMIDLIIYINYLKSQLFVKLTNHTLYNYLMNALRLNLRNEIIRIIIRDKSLKFRTKLKEIARMIEKKMHDDVSKNRRSRIKRSIHRYSLCDRFQNLTTLKKRFKTRTIEIANASEIMIETHEIEMIETIRASIDVDLKIHRRTSSRSNVITAKRRITTKVNVDSRRPSRKMRRRLNRTIRKKSLISRRNLDRAESNN